MSEEAFERAVKHALKTDWSELGVQENKEGDLHFPETIDRRRKGGGTTSLPIMLRLPGNKQRVYARRRAREWLAELKLDEDRDKDLFDWLENYEIMAFCIRDPKEPYDQHVIDGKALFEAYLDTSLQKIWAKLNLYAEACDPRYGDLNAEECWKLAHRIAARGDAAPLGDIAGFDQSACIAFLAAQALKSPTAPSWVRSASTSSPAPQKTTSTSSSSSA